MTVVRKPVDVFESEKRTSLASSTRTTSLNPFRVVFASRGGTILEKTRKETEH